MTTSGPNSPGTIANDSSAGTVAWSNPSNAASSDNSLAEALGLFSGQSSQYLKATNFGFAIPSGATVDGIVVEVEEKSKFGLTDVEDFGVRIVKGGTIGSTDKGRGAVNWPTGAKTYITYGSSSELWGLSWTDTDINASDFGFAIRAVYGGGKSGTPQVDHIRITVYYTAAAGGSVGTMAGDATLSGVGRSSSTSIGTMAGDVTLSGVGRSSSTSIGTMSGDSTLTGVARATASSVGSLNGSATLVVSSPRLAGLPAVILSTNYGEYSDRQIFSSPSTLLGIDYPIF